MKTYKEILTDIERAKKALTAAEEKRKKIEDEIFSSSDWIQRKEIRKAHEKEIVSICKKTTDLKITIKLLKNNARIALFSELVPVICDTFNSYTGKAYGEKTREKISEEIKEKTGCRCYAANSYSGATFKVYTGVYDFDITIGITDKNIFLDNKVQAICKDDLRLWYINNTYFEDIPGTIAAMKKAYKAARAAQEKLDSLCSEFNAFAVDGIDHIYKNKHISEVFEG